MSEKLKVAIRLSADPKDALNAFAALKKKSLDARAALKQTQKQLAATVQRMQAAGGKDIHLARQFDAARHKARELKQAWQEQQTAARTA